MLPLKHLFFFALQVAFIASLSAQKTEVYSEFYRSLKTADQMFAEGAFGAAQKHYEDIVKLSLPVNEPRYKTLAMQAELGYAKCAMRLEDPNGERLMMDFIRYHSPDPAANEALFEIANFYFSSKDYKKAQEYFNKAPIDALSSKQKSEVFFKSGYAHLVNKDIESARKNFAIV